MPGFRFLRGAAVALGWTSRLSHRDLRILLAMRSARLIAPAIVLGAVFQPAAVAITINMTYSNEGDSLPHDENPSWDPAGVYLKSHFAAAKSIWESLLPGSGDISLDFEWDDDLEATQLGVTIPGPNFQTLNDLIEINPNQPWFVDATPSSDFEFGASTQVLYSGLTPAQRTTYFPNIPPPAGLEVGFKRAGLAIAGAENGVRADMGFDLLTVILHEMGHALGINSDASGPYFFKEGHLGGQDSVSVQKDNDSGHLAGDGDLPVLMCNACAVPGERVLPSATDVLAIANVQDINNVRLQRVGRLGGGNWNNTNSWIGADVPDATQDVYVHQAGAVTLDVNVVAKSLVIDGGSSVDATGYQLASSGDLRFDGGAITAGAGAVVAADAIHGDPATLTTAAGSTIEFNNFTRGASSATAATFNGNVKTGVGSVSAVGALTFNPDTIEAWTIGQNLTIGASRAAKLVIDDGAWSVGGNLHIQGTPLVESEVVVEGGTLGVTGLVTIGGHGALTYKSQNASNTTYTISGGGTGIFTSPPPTHLRNSPAGRMTFESISPAVPVGAGGAIINVEGGTGDGGPGAVVTFKGNSYAADADFWTKAGVGGVSLRISNPVVIAGIGGNVTFEDQSNAFTAHFRNDGVAAHGPTNSGGSTYFRDDSHANGAVFDNYGSTLQSYTGAVPAPGGRTVFFDDASAWDGDFNNHPGQGMGAYGAGITAFYGNSKAANGTFYNKGGVTGAQFGGSVEFYDTAKAGEATFYNEDSPNQTEGAFSAGNVRFYGSSSADHAKFYNQVGGGTVYFNDSSTADDASFFIEDTSNANFYGHVVFNGNSKGGTSDITVKENCVSGGVEFRGTSNAEHAVITYVNGSNAGMLVTNSSSLGNANVDMGSASSILFRESATAATSTLHFRPGAGGDFTGGGTTAANSTITLDGATVANGGTGSLNFSGGNAGNATIYVNGGTGINAAGGTIGFNNGANAGTATVIGGAGISGGGGARINLDTSSTAANAKFTIGANGYLSLGGFGDAVLGSLDNAGSVFLGQTGLRVGGLNILNFINGPITGFSGNTNAKLTKVGINLLELNGANTYAGLTKVDGGTLAINGSTPGAVEVNTGAIFKGRGTIGGTVTVNTGGKFAPGNSVIDAPSIITIGGLAMTSAGTLDFELGPTSYDRIQSAGNLVFAGTLNVALVGGFMPTIGSTFDLFNWGSKSGTFSAVNLPTLAPGLSWDTTQLYISGLISVATPPGVSGDYNNNGVVDSSDYVLWRKGGPLANEVDTPGTVNAADYAAWRARFGNPGSGSGAGATANTAVPEPSTLVLLVLAAAGVCLRPRRAVHPGLKHGSR